MTRAGTWHVLIFRGSLGDREMQRLADKKLRRRATLVGAAVVLAWTLGIAIQFVAHSSDVAPLSAVLAVCIGGALLFVAASTLTRSLGWALRGRGRRP